MGIFTDEIKILKKADEPLYQIPMSAQQCIEIKKVSKSGIFQVNEKKYSKSYEIKDINYVTCDDDNKIGILNTYCKCLNSLEYPYKITIVNKAKDMQEVREQVLYSMKNDGLDNIREAINNNIEGRIIEGSQGVEQHKYLTVTIEENNFNQAKAVFSTIERNITKEFITMNSELKPLSGNERLTLLQNLYSDDEDYQEIKIEDYLKTGSNFKNDLCNPRGFQFPKSGLDFRLGKKYGTALYVKKYPNQLSDEFLVEISSMPTQSIVSIDVVPIPGDIPKKLLESTYMGIEGDIQKQQNIRNKNGNFSSEISYKKRKEKEDVEEMMTDMTENDQKMFLVAINIVILADSNAELKSITQTVKTIGAKHSCKIEVNWLKQRETFNTVLPVGCRQVVNMRTMLTRSLASLVPFRVQELSLKGNVIFYGSNQVSKNVITGNRKTLSNGNGFYLGVPGSGKSFDAKTEMAGVYVGSDDDIVIIDPTLEYLDIVEEFHGSVINLSSDTENYINPLHVDINAYCTAKMNTIIRNKSKLMLGICAQSMTEEINSRHKSIIDRCIRNLYRNIEKLPASERYIPIMTNFRDELLVMEEEEASDIALSLELFVDGSLNIFNHQTNVDVDNRLTAYGIRDLDRELFPVAMLIMLEYIDERIEKNTLLKKATWLYIDEIHELLMKEFTAAYLFKCWKKHRKQGGIDTGLTQNISDLLRCYSSKTMLSNSEFIMLLKQSAPDAEDLCQNIEGITSELLRYVINAPSGTGIMKHGNVIVPFDNRVEKDNPLYQLFNTNLHEKAAMEKDLEESVIV